MSKAMQVNAAAELVGIKGRDVRMSRMLPGMAGIAASLNAAQNQNLTARQGSPAPTRP